MKKQTLIIISAVLMLIAGLNGCKKGYFDINNNPNNATNASPQLVLSNALTVTASTQETGFNFLNAWMGYLGQSGSYATGVGDIASYKETNNFGIGLWDGRYHNLEDYDYVEKAATASNDYFYVGAAKIMKAFVFQQLVDMFNNVPYTDALHGTQIILTKYDDGQTIYHSIVAQIDTAVILMSRADAIGSAKSDVLFGGDNSLWIQFANTLKLRILVRESQVASEASFIATELGNVPGGFLTQDAAVNPGYANNSGQQNPVWGFFITLANLPTSGGGFDFWKGSQYAITWLTNNNDPRVFRLYTAGSDTSGPSKMVGSVLGAVTNPAGATGASPGPGILKSVSQSAVILSLAESDFLQAEANLRGWLPGTDSVNYNNGVKASFAFLGASDTSAYSYLTQGDNQTNYSLCTTFAQKLACIIRQKWIANDQVTPFESWCDYRRLGLPADIPLSISPFLDQAPASIPVRILYPSDEYQENAVNVSAQGTIDYHASKVFWQQ